ncbi:unnamed protein product [Cyclocybe aegerita]|uniref:Uncharacterized protein n=1 Tax=Cyclocybe aegerita TaxID=1973307 RepID=A0A8S0WR81_CYCAE|nr:unnamed protein product [Cyclocybe aegerita]
MLKRDIYKSHAPDLYPSTIFSALVMASNPPPQSQSSAKDPSTEKAPHVYVRIGGYSMKHGSAVAWLVRIRGKNTEEELNRVERHYPAQAISEHFGKSLPFLLLPYGPLRGDNTTEYIMAILKTSGFVGDEGMKGSNPGVPQFPEEEADKEIRKTFIERQGFKEHELEFKTGLRYHERPEVMHDHPRIKAWKKKHAI